jgi:hypothetical protein
LKLSAQAAVYRPRSISKLGLRITVVDPLARQAPPEFSCPRSLLRGRERAAAA